MAARFTPRMLLTGEFAPLTAMLSLGCGMCMAVSARNLIHNPDVKWDKSKADLMVNKARPDMGMGHAATEEKKLFGGHVKDIATRMPYPETAKH